MQSEQSETSGSGMESLTPEEVEMIGGGTNTGTRSPPPPPPTTSPITVTANPPPPPPTTSPITVTANPPPPPVTSPITVTASPPSGSPPSPPPPGSSARQVATYDKNCSSANGSAVDIAKTIKGSAVVGPPNPITDPEGNDWTKVEFAAIVHGSGSTYSAYNSAIYSNNQSLSASMPNPPSDAQGMIHNHPQRGDAGQQNIDKYPSDQAGVGGGVDWQSLQTFATRSNNPDPSLWILGPDGVTREFKLSDRAYYQGLTEDEMKQGVGLDGKDRNQSCN